MPAIFQMQTAGHHGGRRFRGAIGAPPFQWVMRGPRTDGQDNTFARFHHMGQGRFGRVKHPFDINVDQFGPCVDVRILDPRNGMQGRGIVDDNIQPPKCATV